MLYEDSSIIVIVEIFKIKLSKGLEPKSKRMHFHEIQVKIFDNSRRRLTLNKDNKSWNIRFH